MIFNISVFFLVKYSLYFFSRYWSLFNALLLLYHLVNLGTKKLQETITTAVINVIVSSVWDVFPSLYPRILLYEVKKAVTIIVIPVPKDNKNGISSLLSIWVGGSITTFSSSYVIVNFGFGMKKSESPYNGISFSPGL